MYLFSFSAFSIKPLKPSVTILNKRRASGSPLPQYYHSLAQSTVELSWIQTVLNELQVPYTHCIIWQPKCSCSCPQTYPSCKSKAYAHWCFLRSGESSNQVDGCSPCSCTKSMDICSHKATFSKQIYFFDSQIQSAWDSLKVSPTFILRGGGY